MLPNARHSIVCAGRGRRVSESVHVPRAGLRPPLLLYFPDSLTRHPRLATAGSVSASQNAKSPQCEGLCVEKHCRHPGRGWATGCGAYAAPRSTGLVARARSAPRQLTRRACLSGANASSRSEFRDGAVRPMQRARTQTVLRTVCAWRAPGPLAPAAGDPACKAARCIRSRRRWPTRGPALTLEGVRKEFNQHTQEFA